MSVHPKFRKIIDGTAAKQKYDDIVKEAIETHEQGEAARQQAGNSQPEVRKIIFYERTKDDVARLVCEDRTEIRIPINKQSFFAIVASGKILVVEPHEVNPNGLTAVITDKTSASSLKLYGSEEVLCEFKNVIFPALTALS